MAHRLVRSEGPGFPGPSTRLTRQETFTSPVGGDALTQTTAPSTLAGIRSTRALGPFYYDSGLRRIETATKKENFGTDAGMSALAFGAIFDRMMYRISVTPTGSEGSSDIELGSTSDSL